MKFILCYNNNNCYNLQVGIEYKYSFSIYIKEIIKGIFD